MEDERKFQDILLPDEKDIINPVTGFVWLNEQTVSHQGIWRIHKSDPDRLFPSDPHADRVDEPGEKLNLYNGEVYSPKKQFLYKLSKKSIQYIYYKIINEGEDEVIKKLNDNKSRISFLNETESN
jgi:hypothetical protein